MEFVLQIWGGLFYLTNKICFAFAEGNDKKRKRQLKIIGWVIYILGVPAWITILVIKHDWIAASMEAGGIPAMLLGLITVYKKSEKPTFLLNSSAVPVRVFKQSMVFKRRHSNVRQTNQPLPSS